jgi:hypothetical protein
MKAFQLVVLVVVGCLAARAEAGGAQASFMARDSAGVRIVESARGFWSAPWVIRDVPITRIVGTAERPLTSITSATRLSDGRVVVTVPRPGALHWYSSSGEHLRTVGGGAFLGHVFRVAGDSVAAIDLSLGRMTVFPPGGGPGRVVHIYGEALPLGRFADGTYLMRDGWSFPLAADGPPRIERYAMQISSFSEATGAVRPMMLAPGEEFVVAPAGTLFDDGSLRYGMRQRPFGSHTRAAGNETGFVVGDTDRAEVQFRDSGGALRTVARWNAERRAVTSADVETERAERLARVRDPAVRERLVASLPQLPPPPALRPVFGSILMDALGNAWLEQFTGPGEPPSGRFEVIDPSGVWLGTVQLPRGLRPAEIGDDWLLAWTVGTGGERTVLVLGIAKP